MNKFFLLIFLVSFFPSKNSLAGLIFGSGVTSATAGRVSPVLNLGLDYSSFALTATSVGVENTYYYHSAYNLVLVSQREFSKYLWGDLRGGIGLGAHYAKRGLKDGTNAEEIKSDYAIGPAIRLTWEFIPYCFIGLEAIYGIRNLNFVILSTQNIRSLVLGVRF